MSRTIVIDPVTRIEGHAKITIQLDDEGEVADAHFHVTQLRGFEKICEGRPFHEMPSLMARICGICPVSHLVASAKACDDLMAVQIPEAATDLRRVMNLAQWIQSHALSFFYLSSPDLLLGMDADPAKRNIVGVLQAYPELARGGVRLRQFGQQVIEMLGGKRIHPGWIVPGGVSEPLSVEKRDAILSHIPEVKSIILKTIEWFKSVLYNYSDEIRTFGNFPTLYMGMVKGQHLMAHYDGLLRVVDADGNILQSGIKPRDYAMFIAEKVEPWSYLKSPYYKPLGYPEGIYRVGPLARMRVITHYGTPLADHELDEFRALPLSEQQSSFYFHYARLLEILYGIEKIDHYLTLPETMSKHVRAFAQPNRLEGVGMAEAPRGTLIHHYFIDENGLITKANLIIATGHNNLAMNKGVQQVAKHYVKSDKLTEGMLNRVEAVIRTYDPCLSCSTHAFGEMPLHLELRDFQGKLLDEVQR